MYDRSLVKDFKKKGIFLLLTVIMTLSFSFAAIYFMNSFQDSRANELATGLISIEFTEGSEVINLTDVTPVIDDVGILNQPYEFTVKNTSKVPINAKIGLEIDETTTIHPGAIRYAFYISDELIKIDHLGNLEEGVLYTIENMAINESLDCKLIFWIDYYYETPLETFKANIKVVGESFDIFYEYNPNGAQLIIDKLGTGGLVAINTAGTLYDANDSTQEIREYRYSGATANNYVIFNDDGDDVEKEANELWRIVGVFKNSAGEWNLKLMRNTLMTTDELPSTYTYGGTTYNIEKDTSASVYWNSVGTNDWTTAGLQYFLNTTSDTSDVVGYYSVFSNKAKKLIDTNYTYYLGSVGVTSAEQDTTISAYKSERGTKICASSVTENIHSNNCDIWYGNKPSWPGAIGLLYLSDYGYSADSSNWSSLTIYNYDSVATTSWMYQTANHSTTEWLISPATIASFAVARWYYSGDASYGRSSGTMAVRPVLNLVSTAPMDIEHEGTESDPYIIIE